MEGKNHSEQNKRHQNEKKWVQSLEREEIHGFFIGVSV